MANHDTLLEELPKLKILSKIISGKFMAFWEENQSRKNQINQDLIKMDSLDFVRQWSYLSRRFDKNILCTLKSFGIAF